MDPTIHLCNIYNHDNDNNNYDLHTYINSGEVSINSKIVLSESKSLRNVKFSLCNNIREPETIFATPVNDTNLLTNPFKFVSHEPFMNIDSIILANIDAVFNFSYHTSGYILKQETTKDYSFVCINDEPGGYSQYIMYRNPSSRGYASSVSKIKNYEESKLDLTHLNIYNYNHGGEDFYKDFIQNIRNIEATGVDTVLANNNTDDNYYNYLLNLLISINTVKIGGSFICKINLDKEKLNSLMTDLFIITSKCYKKITLFKPISEDLNNNVHYLIAENANRNNINWSNILENAYSESRKQNKHIVSILVDNINEKSQMTAWINQYFNKIQLHKEKINHYAREGIKELYDTYKCKAVWNLPQI